MPWHVSKFILGLANFVVLLTNLKSAAERRTGKKEDYKASTNKELKNTMVQQFSYKYRISLNASTKGNVMISECKRL